MLPPSFLQSFSFYFSFLFYCLFTVYRLIEQVNTESWAPQSPAASGLFSLVIVVVAGHGALYPLSQQVRPQMLWLTGNVAIAAHVAVTCGKQVNVTFNIHLLHSTKHLQPLMNKSRKKFYHCT